MKSMTKRRQDRLSIMLLILAIISLATTVSSWIPYTERVISGELVELRGLNDPVHLMGIDCPCVDDSCGPDTLWGRRAVAFLDSISGTGQLRLCSDYDGFTYDANGYLYAYLELESPHADMVLNLELIRRGYCRARLCQMHLRLVEFLDAELQARQARLGLWAVDSSACAPIGIADSIRPRLLQHPFDSIMYYSVGGAIYHRLGCIYNNGRIERTTIRRAAERGFTACRWCRPPQIDE